MKILNGREIAARLDGIVHADTQLSDRGVDLTVAELHAVTDGGRLDFGGSELEPAASERLEPELAAPDDDYGWWHLPAGSYLVVYNEALRLGDGELGRIEPLPRLLRAGASHPAWTTVGSAEPTTLLAVGNGGCHLKENCRVSRLSVVAVD